MKRTHFQIKKMFKSNVSSKVSVRINRLTIMLQRKKLKIIFEVHSNKRILFWKYENTVLDLQRPTKNIYRKYKYMLRIITMH